MKRIWIVTLFPDYFLPLKEMGVVGQALRGERATQENNFHHIQTVNPRDFSLNNYKQVDDYPFGGGVGMVMKPDVMKRALLEGIVQAGNYGADWKSNLHIVYPCPRGQTWSNTLARDFAKNYLAFDAQKDLVFICGRYEGIDERFLDQYVDQYLSLGDFILSGGEPAVLAMLDSSMRFVDGVLGNKVSAEDESFEGGLLEYPHYTRPRDFDGAEPPEVLLSGHHLNIEKWKTEQRVLMTKKYRPDLLNEK